jgi:hypothetical protein
VPQRVPLAGRKRPTELPLSRAFSVGAYRRKVTPASVILSLLFLWPASRWKIGGYLRQLVCGGRVTPSLQSQIMCTLPHGANGRVEERAILRLWQSYRVPVMRDGFVSESGRKLLDDLSTEATRAGICPNHLHVLRCFVAIALYRAR